jgi:hypothetical protein
MRLNEEVTILTMIAADDWWALVDWPDYQEYQEVPIIAFANYRASYFDYSDDQYCTYDGIGPVIENWSDGNDGIQYIVITINNRRNHGVLEVYKGKGKGRRRKRAITAKLEDDYEEAPGYAA